MSMKLNDALITNFSIDDKEYDIDLSFNKVLDVFEILKEEEMTYLEQAQLIDFEQDAEYIYASFLQAYGINLLKVQNKLTWTEFKALLNALPDNTIMQQIIEIRAWKPEYGGDKNKMRKLQAKYSLGKEGEDNV